MNLDLTNKIAFVAASSDGLGFATALELAREKAKVILASRSTDKLQIAKDKILAEVPDANLFISSFDLLDEQDIKKAMEKAANAFGGIDILITNAAGPKAGKFGELSITDWQSAFQISLMSAVHLIYAAFPFLQESESGSILTITSTSGKQPIPGLFLSNVFRPAVLGMTKALSVELAPHNVRVNSILPGWTGTDRSKQLLEFYAKQNKSSIEAEIARISNDIPLKRMAEPAEFGKVAAFLVSPAASYLTGVMLQVDGGRISSII